MLELFPAGFEEGDVNGALELAAYGDAAAERRVRATFAGVRRVAVAPGWEDGWRVFHRPVTVGPLWIGPPWERPPPGVVPVVIEPGRAFGTGAHATTRICVGLVAALPRGSLLDLGCGSGVVAVAAAKLGFAPVFAVDNDDAAVEATARNAAANGVPIDVRAADVLVDEVPPADVAVANIAIGPVRSLAARVDCRRLVASGYRLEDRLRAIAFRHVERREADGWAADLFERASRGPRELASPSR